MYFRREVFYLQYKLVKNKFLSLESEKQRFARS